MSVFFAFSDESGKYKKERSDKFISKNPFYCRCAVLFRADEWLKLRDRYFLLKKNLLDIDPGQEVKWSYIWSLYKHHQKKENIPSHKPYYALRRHPLDSLVQFIRKSLQLLSQSVSCRIILTLTFNQRQKTGPVDTTEIIKQHLEHGLEMAEGEMRTPPENVCVFFFSPEEPLVERKMKRAFSGIYGAGLSPRFFHIKDSLNFELSGRSFGAQLADYCAGVFNGCLRLYPQSIDLFRHQIWPKMLKKEDKVLGYGLTEIPKNTENRESLEGILDKVFAAPEKDYRVSIQERLKSKNIFNHKK
ncbi:MAG: DUF3800 domain-containing protein [Candidatus Aminicenantes bacterium]